MSSSQADSGEPRLKLSTDKECSRRNTNDNLDKWNWKSTVGKCRDIGKRIHPSCPQPTSWISWLERTSRCATRSRKSVPTIFSSIPVMSQHQLSLVVVSCGLVGLLLHQPCLAWLFDTNYSGNCFPKFSAWTSETARSPQKRAIIVRGQLSKKTRPNFLENGPITFQHTLTSQAF